VPDVINYVKAYFHLNRTVSSHCTRFAPLLIMNSLFAAKKLAMGLCAVKLENSAKF